MSDDANTSTTIPITVTTDCTFAHGTAVALGSRAALFVGPSGSGKSGLALELIAFGCTLVGDDRVQVEPSARGVILSAPPEITGKIEARGMGILTAMISGPAILALVVDLGQIVHVRLPLKRAVTILDVDVPLFHKVESGHFAAAILQYLKADAA